MCCHFCTCVYRFVLHFRGALSIDQSKNSSKMHQIVTWNSSLGNQVSLVLNSKTVKLHENDFSIITLPVFSEEQLITCVWNTLGYHGKITENITEKFHRIQSSRITLFEVESSMNWPTIIISKVQRERKRKANEKSKHTSSSESLKSSSKCHTKENWKVFFLFPFLFLKFSLLLFFVICRALYWCNPLRSVTIWFPLFAGHWGSKIQK